MALRTPLSVTPHLYMGDSTGRPLDMGTVYFGEQDKDPEFYPIDLFSDDALTLPLAQPVHTKGGYLYDKGDMVEPHAKEIIYSVKVLDSYGRKVFYKGAMMRNSWNDDVIQQINTAIIESQGAAVVAAEKAVNDAINNTAVDGGILADTFVTGTVKGTGGVARNQRGINSDITSVFDFYDTNLPTYNTAFNNAINYLSAKGGGTVHIPDGVYPIDPVVGVTLKSNVELRGSTNVVFEAVAHNAANYQIIRAHGINNWKVSGIRVNGRKDLNTATSGEWGMGISVRSSTNGIIEDFIAENCWGDGMYFGRLGSVTDPVPENGGVIPYSQNVNMRNVRCLKNRRQGISVISIKDSTWDNIICNDTDGTAPQDGIDFEPNYIDEVISNLTINGLVTSGNIGYGVQFFLLKWRGLSPTFTEEDLSASEKLLSSEKQALLVSKYISASKDTNKLSVTINNWMHSKGKAFGYRGTHSKYLQGFIEINNSNVNNPNGGNVLDVGSNHAEGVQLYVNKTKLVQSKANSSPHVSVDIGLFDEPLGGVHLQDVDFLLSGSGTVPASYPLLVQDNTNKTTKFANISVLNCKGWGASPYSRIALRCNSHIDNLVLVDNYGAWRMVTFGSAPTISSSSRVSEHIKQDVAGYMAMSITKLPTDIDTYITNFDSPENPAMLYLMIGGEGLLEMPFKNNATTVRFLVPTNYWVKLRGLPNGKMRIVDAPSNLLDASKNFDVTQATVASKSWAVGATETVTVTHPYVAVGDTVIASASTGTAGLTLNAQVTAAKTVEVTITNNTAEAITWGGAVKAKVI